MDAFKMIKEKLIYIRTQVMVQLDILCPIRTKISIRKYITFTVIIIASILRYYMNNDDDFLFISGNKKILFV